MPTPFGYVGIKPLKFLVVTFKGGTRMDDAQTGSRERAMLTAIAMAIDGKDDVDKVVIFEDDRPAYTLERH